MVRHLTLGNYWWRGNNSIQFWMVQTVIKIQRHELIEHECSLTAIQINFLSRRGETVWRNNPSQGDNVAPAEVPTAKWQRENVGESEVGWSETLFLGNRKGVGKQIVQPPFLILQVLVWFYGEKIWEVLLFFGLGKRKPEAPSVHLTASGSPSQHFDF